MTTKAHGRVISDASLAEVTATGSSTARSLATWTKYIDPEVINVKLGPYFAKGDGITDDTAAIQAAITAAASGGVVFFPVGTYIVSTTPSSGTIFTISASNITLRGSGMKASIIKSSAAMGDGHQVFVLTGDKQVIEDLGFDAAVSSVGKPCVEFRGATLGSFRRCWSASKFGWSAMASTLSSHIVFSDNISDGTSQSHNFEINGSSYCVIERCEMNSTSSAGNGVEIYDNDPNPCHHNILRNNWIHGPRTASGIQIYGGTHTIVEGNTIEGATVYGIFTDGSSVASIPTTDTTIRGNIIRAVPGTAGICVGGAAGSTYRTTVMGNSVTGCLGTGGGGSPGILVNSSGYDTTLVGNICSGNQSEGILVTNGVKRATIIGNVCTDNSQVGVGSRYGLSVYGDFHLVMGNISEDTRAASARQNGILIGSGSTFVKLIGNSVPYAQSGPYINDAGTGTVKIGNYGLPVDKPSITGSRGSNAALASLLTALAGQGHIVDNSSA
jgi:parallel beta-helix repeat protein